MKEGRWTRDFEKRFPDPNPSPFPPPVFGSCSFLVALTSSRSSFLCTLFHCSLLFSLVLDFLLSAFRLMPCPYFMPTNSVVDQA